MTLQLCTFAQPDGQPLPYPEHSHWVDPQLLAEMTVCAEKVAASKARVLGGELVLVTARVSPEYPDLVELTFKVETSGA